MRRRLQGALLGVFIPWILAFSALGFWAMIGGSVSLLELVAWVVAIQFIVLVVLFLASIYD
jgi:hypothetical protein